MTKTNDILKEARKELERRLDYREDNSLLYKSGFDNSYQVDEIELWNFIETVIKKALQAREREIVEEIYSYGYSTDSQGKAFYDPRKTMEVIQNLYLRAKMGEDISEMLEELSNKTKEEE